MKDISEYINDTQFVEESVFDLDKNIESGPNWEKTLIDWIVGNGGVTIGGTGCDCLGRKVEPGDWVVFLDAGGHFGTGKRLNVGKVIAVKKQISIALFLPKQSQDWWNNKEIERISRPSEYVFKISDPQKLASEVV